MITHYDMNTGEIIDQDGREGNGGSPHAERLALQARLMTVDEAVRIENGRPAPAAAVVMLPIAGLVGR